MPRCAAMTGIAGAMTAILPPALTALISGPARRVSKKCHRDPPRIARTIAKRVACTFEEYCRWHLQFRRGSRGLRSSPPALSLPCPARVASISASRLPQLTVAAEAAVAAAVVVEAAAVAAMVTAGEMAPATVVVTVGTTAQP